MSGTNFRGGRKLSPKPSAFESEIHPTHKPSVYAPGISPCRGQICACANLQSERAGLYLSMPPQKAGAWMLLLWAATFLSKYAATLTGLRRSPPAAVRNRQPRTARIRAVVRSKPPYGGCSYKSGGIRLSTKGKEKGIFEKKFIYRNGKAA